MSRKPTYTVDQVAEAIQASRGILTVAARRLGCDRRTVSRYLERHPEPSPYVFPGDTRTGWWTISSYEKTLLRACDKLGLKPYTPHYLRHFYATYLLQQGAKLEVVSHILCHASIGTTGDIYRHVLTTEMHEASRQFAPLQDIPRLGVGRGDVVDGEFTEVKEDD